ncbi:MAG TPA: hypothetical protein VMH88_08990 [Gemmatimonadales bacterium]|nr:hypothetical protein [Gemmatimonadales bacterium]
MALTERRSDRENYTALSAALRRCRPHPALAPLAMVAGRPGRTKAGIGIRALWL